MDNKSLTRKLNISVALIIILSVALAAISFALGMMASDRINANKYSTGGLDVSISNASGISLIDQIEPGMTLVRSFTVNNNSEIGVYYKVYFENLTGALKDVLAVTVLESSSGETLYQGLAKDFVKSSPLIKSGAEIPAGASRDLTITFKFPEGAGSDYTGSELNFDLTVLAVQSKNNPEKSFD